MKITKTNAMRQLDAAKIKYEIMEYVPDESDLSGTHIAEQIGLPCERVFKTLVTVGDKNGINVICIPANLEIDLKAAAVATGNKRLEMLKTADLLATTGYIRGGCSPVGMKKKFPTYIDATAVDYEKITVSSGTRGMQLLLDPKELIKFTGAKTCSVTKNE